MMLFPLFEGINVEFKIERPSRLQFKGQARFWQLKKAAPSLLLLACNWVGFAIGSPRSQLPGMFMKMDCLAEHPFGSYQRFRREPVS